MTIDYLICIYIYYIIILYMCSIKPIVIKYYLIKSVEILACPNDCSMYSYHTGSRCIIIPLPTEWEYL